MVAQAKRQPFHAFFHFSSIFIHFFHFSSLDRFGQHPILFRTRIYHLARSTSAQPEDEAVIYHFWTKTNDMQNVPNFSAVCLLYAKNLALSLENKVSLIICRVIVMIAIFGLAVCLVRVLFF
jgi:hypothetical protein